jgi:hypothetical protein
MPCARGGHVEQTERSDIEQASTSTRETDEHLLTAIGYHRLILVLAYPSDGIALLSDGAMALPLPTPKLMV